MAPQKNNTATTSQPPAPTPGDGPWSAPVLRRALGLFLLAAVVLCTAFVVFYRQEMSNEAELMSTRQSNLVRAEKQLMQRTLDSVLIDTMVLAKLPLLTLLPANPATADLRPAISYFMAFMAGETDFDQIRFLGPDGRELLRINQSPEGPVLVPTEELQDKSSRYYVRDTLALKPGQGYVSRFDLNIECGAVETPHRPVIRLAAPVHGPGGRLKGMVVLNFSGSILLQELREFNHTPATMMLVNREGFWLMGPTPADEWGFMLGDGKGPLFSERFPEAWKDISNRREGQFRGPQGLFTYAWLDPPSSHGPAGGWYLVAFVPNSVAAEATSRYQARRLAVLGTLLAVAAVLCHFFALGAHRRRQSEERIRRAAQNRQVINQLLSLGLGEGDLAHVMEQALDIIFSAKWLKTLPAGCIFLAEPGPPPSLRIIAQRNMDPRTAQLCDRVPWGHCHCGRAAAEGQPTQATCIGAGHQNRHQGMADHGHYTPPLLMGRRCLGVLHVYLPPGHQVTDDDAAFLDSVAGVLAGLIDRQQAEDAVRESEARLRAIVNTAVEGVVTIGSDGIVEAFNPAAEKIFGYAAEDVVGRNVSMLAPDPIRARHDGFIKNYLETGQAKVIGIGREVEGRKKDGTLFPLYLSLSEVRLGPRILFTGILRDITELKQAEENLREAKENAEKISAQLLAKQKLLDEDMRAASGIQKTLLPEAMPYLEEVALAWKFIPSQDIGGDILGAMMLDEEHLCVYVLDVSGHGVPAALVTVSVHELLEPFSGHVVEGYGTNRPEVTPPVDLMNLLDREYPLERFGKFFTIFYGLLNVRTGTLTYSNAGHPPPLLRRSDGSLTTLEAGGTLIGMGGAFPYQQAQVSLAPGDRLLLYTDGVIEHADEEGGMFGPDRLSDAWAELSGLGLDDTLDELWRRVHAFGRGSEPADDISLLALQYTPPSGRGH